MSSRPPGMPEPTLRLTFPDEGLADGQLLVRLPRENDLDALVPAFADSELREAGNLPPFGREELLATLPHLPELVASGRLLPLVVLEGDEVVGGGTLHHLDAERSIIELGYWLYSRGRGRGIATRVARLLAEHAFSIGVERVAAYVDLGNGASERVLERVGFTREGVIRSLPKADGTREDRTVFSLLPGE